MTRERIDADEAYETSEGVRTLVNAISMLLASAPDEYTFWSAFYKFAVENRHRVTTASEYQRLKKADMDWRNEQLSRAAKTLTENPPQSVGAHIDMKGYIESLFPNLKK